MGDITRLIRRIVQAPDALCAQSVLAAAALAAQAHANVLIDGRSRPLSLFFCTVGESGERKTAVDDIALEPHKQREKQLVDAHAEEIIQWESAKQAWEYSRAEILKKKGQ